MVSIIIPIYNVEQYIYACIESVEAQTYKNYEVILIDDCGADGSMKIVNDYVHHNHNKKDERWRIIRHEKNKGLSAARNTGINAANGEFLLFLDSDDEITPDCIELMMDMVKRYPEVEIVQAGTTNNEDWEETDLPYYSEDKVWIKTSFLTERKIPVTAWNKLIKREFLIKNHLFFKEGIIHEDELWNWYLAKYVNKIAFLKKGTYIYNIRPQSIITSNSNEKKEKIMLAIQEECAANIDDFCKKAQVSFLIYRLHRTSFYGETQSNRDKAVALLKNIMPKCNLSQYIATCFIVYLPLWINCRKVVYQKLINKVLLDK